ncbi:MAG: glycosyltransferase, partial [Alphaproteobacteria bacterium]|nr:glycosyltransferase [Alphaproteobacteria bacterium]
GKFPKPWVGVAWAGNPDHVTDYQRSVGMHRLLSTLQPFVGAGTFFSLQKNADEDALQKNYPFVISLAPHLNSYDDTAALLTQLNTLVCSDTSLVHAAGALGVPCHVLLHHDPFWVFGTAGDKTPWYPTLTLHRQPSPRDWAGCLQSLIKKLF